MIWDESNELLYTEKFVKIIQPENQDTTTGFGFETNQDFTRFEIKRRGSASLNVEQLKADFEKEMQEAELVSSHFSVPCSQ